MAINLESTILLILTCSLILLAIIPVTRRIIRKNFNVQSTWIYWTAALIYIFFNCLPIIAMLTEKFKWNANYVNAIEAIIGFGLLGITFFHRSKDVILKRYALLYGNKTEEQFDETKETGLKDMPLINALIEYEILIINHLTIAGFTMCFTLTVIAIYFMFYNQAIPDSTYAVYDKLNSTTGITIETSIKSLIIVLPYIRLLFFSVVFIIVILNLIKFTRSSLDQSTRYAKNKQALYFLIDNKMNADEYIKLIEVINGGQENAYTDTKFDLDIAKTILNKIPFVGKSNS